MLSNHQQFFASSKALETNKKKFLAGLEKLLETASYEPQLSFFHGINQFSSYIQPAFYNLASIPENFLENSARLRQCLDSFITQLTLIKSNNRHLMETEIIIRRLLQELLPTLYSYYTKFFKQFMQHPLIKENSNIMEGLAKLLPYIGCPPTWEKIYTLSEIRKLFNCIHHVIALHQPLETSAVQQIEKYLKTILPILDKAKLENDKILLVDSGDSSSEDYDSEYSSSEEEEDTLDLNNYVIRVAVR